MFICGGSQAGKAPTQAGLAILPWVCPSCDGGGNWDDGLPCEMCKGRGAVDDETLGVWDRSELKRTPTPPGVMKGACRDCAFRPGSPEDQGVSTPAVTAEPFSCHHGMPVVDGDYSPTAWFNGRPLGALVCAGWWAAQTGQPLPAEPYRPSNDGWGQSATTKGDQ